MIDCDITNGEQVMNTVGDIKPDYIYNLASQSFIPQSWEDPIGTFNINTCAVVNILEAIIKVDKGIRFFQASSAEVFGEPKESVQTENTPFNPRNPYGVSKASAHMLVRNYREKYNLHASNGIMYNHESPRRGLSFVTKKITTAVNIITGNLPNTITNEYGERIIEEDGRLHIGNMDALRDWGNAKDYVKAMKLITQSDTPDDYIIASGKLHSVKQLIDFAFKSVDINNWMDYVIVDPRFYRENEKHTLCGDTTKIQERIGWKPELSFEETISDMVLNS